MTIDTYNRPVPVYPNHKNDTFRSQLIDALPVEGMAFLIASFAVRLFNNTLAAPLLGIGISVIITRLVLKAIDCYDGPLLINLTKEACKVNKNYPKLQMITFVCALAFSFISKTLSVLIGACLGSFGSIILDVESYKLLQKANRKL